MSFIRKIKRGGRVYLAEVENSRHGAQVKQKFIRYIGLDPEWAKQNTSVAIRDIKIDHVKLYGAVIALESIARELELFELLGDIAEPILTLVFSHCLGYKSVDEVSGWYENTELTSKFEREKMPVEQLRNAIEKLAEMNSDHIQESVFEKLSDLLGEDSSGVIYDATNTHLVAVTRSSLANKGKDKEGVRNRKLIQIGLGVTRNLGIPIFHHAREGNIHDAMMFREAINQFNLMGIKKGLMVYDRGMTGKTCVSRLADSGWKSLAGMPCHKGIRTLISNLDLSGIENMRNLVIQGETEFFVHSIKHEFNQIKGSLLILQNTRKKQDKARLRRANLVAARDALHNQKTEIPDELKKFFDTRLSMNWHAINRAEKFDGLSFIFTDAKISKKEAVRIYFAKDIIERCFKVEKSILNLRPIRFWLDSKIKAHILICHLALALITTCRVRLEKKGIFEEIGAVFKKLGLIYKIYLSELNGLENSFSKVNTLSKYQSSILMTIAPKLNL